MKGHVSYLDGGLECECTASSAEDGLDFKRDNGASVDIFGPRRHEGDHAVERSSDPARMRRA